MDRPAVARQVDKPWLSLLFLEAVAVAGQVGITEEQIATNLQAILDDANAEPDAAKLAAEAVGVLTTEIRGKWAETRQILSSENGGCACSHQPSSPLERGFD